MIRIFQLEEPISGHIAEALGPGHLTEREAELFDRAQALGSTYVGYVNSDLVACWGIIPPSFLSDRAYLWMWGPPIRYPVTFLRYSRKIIAEALRHYECLHGHCALGSGSFRWLLWLGAEFGPPGADLVPFQLKSPTHG